MKSDNEKQTHCHQGATPKIEQKEYVVKPTEKAKVERVFKLKYFEKDSKLFFGNISQTNMENFQKRPEISM